MGGCVSTKPVSLELQQTCSLTSESSDLPKPVPLTPGSSSLQRSLNSAIESTIDGYAIVGQDGIFTYTNSVYDRIYGYEVQSIIGRHWTQMIHEDNVTKMTKALNDVTETRNVEVVAKCVKGDGTIFYKRAVIVLRDNCYFHFIKDITSQKNYELSLIEDKRIAEHANSMKSRFVANISHEIRTPINGIVGMASLLQTTDLTKDQLENVSIILDSANSLLLIVSDILDFSRIESGQSTYDIDEFNIKELLQVLLDIYKSQVLTQKLSITYLIEDDVPLCIKSDKNKLRQIITNLINNSLKFTKYGGVVVRVKRIGNFLQFEVKDTGIGIPNEKLLTVLEPFVQADDSINKNYGGTGLGLTICKNLIDFMGGSLEIESKVGSGTSVYFTIPVYNGEAARNLTLYGKNDKCVIIVEDNKTNQIVLQKIVKRAGFADVVVLVYNTGKEAVDNIEVFENVSQAINLMDYHMPEMDGFTCTTILRSRGISFPIVMISANADIQVREKCLQNGMNDFYLKPITVQNVQTIFKTWFK